MKDDNDKHILLMMASLLSITYFIVSKFGIWWGSEWCAYGTAITGYITYSYLN